VNKREYLKMAQSEKDLDIYDAVGNANTQIQENRNGVIMKKRNSAGWKFISTSTENSR